MILYLLKNNLFILGSLASACIGDYKLVVKDTFKWILTIFGYVK